MMINKIPKFKIDRTPEDNDDYYQYMQKYFIDRIVVLDMYDRIMKLGVSETTMRHEKCRNFHVHTIEVQQNMPVAHMTYFINNVIDLFIRYATLKEVTKIHLQYNNVYDIEFYKDNI